jgi:ribosomal protein L7/L12
MLGSAMDDIGQRIGDLVAAGQKIEAIKLLREATGLGLADAKSAIDAVGSGAPIPPHVLQRIDAHAADASAEDLPADVLAAAATGNRIEAIRLLREQRGLGLKEAKDLLDRVVPVPAGAKKGCLLPLFCLGLVGWGAVLAVRGG